MDIHSIDLNLLVLFDTLMKARSVNKTAEAIGLSQSATSGALARLRETFDDPLFVRTASQMEPTPRALQLAPVVRKVVTPMARYSRGAEYAISGTISGGSLCSLPSCSPRFGRAM